jgi:hypothetical protein
MSTGVWPFGAQVALTEGRRLNPLSSWKTIQAFLALAFFYLGPAFVDPALDGLIIPLCRLSGRPLTAPAHPAEDLPDVSGVVLHPGGPLDHLGHPGQGPQIGRIAIGLRPLLQGPFHLGQVAVGHQARPAGRSGAFQGLLPSDLPELVPVRDRLVGNPEFTADVRLGHPLGEQVGSPHPGGLHGLEIPAWTDSGWCLVRAGSSG